MKYAEYNIPTSYERKFHPMKKFVSLLLVLVLSLCSVLPAFAADTAFNWSAADYIAMFDVMLTASAEKTATWVEKDAQTYVGAYTNSPEIIVSSENDKVTKINMELVVNLGESTDFYNRAYAMGEALACVAISAALLNDPAVLADAEGLDQFTASLQNMLTNATQNLDYSKECSTSETLTYAGFNLTCTVTFSPATLIMSIAFDMVPVI